MTPAVATRPAGWVLRALISAHTVAIFGQPVFAGVYLSGDYEGLRLHATGADVVTWRLIADVHHPVHLHLVGFQVLSRGGQSPGPYDAGLKDTVSLRPGEAVEIITRFDGYRGRFLFHCHNAEHEDMGMMANLEIV